MKNFNTYLNIILGIFFASFILFASKHIDDKKSVLFNNYFKLFLLIGILIIYPYNKQIGIIILIIVIVLQSSLFKERFVDFITPQPLKSSVYPTPTYTSSSNNVSEKKIEENELEKIESNYKVSIDKRKKEKEQDGVKNKIIQDKRLNMYQDEGLINPLEKKVIDEIQQKFNDNIGLLKTDDFKKISQYTDEGDPINAGLLPLEIDSEKAGINYEDLVKSGEIIKF